MALGTKCSYNNSMLDLGQLFMTGISGKTLLDEEAKFIAHNNIGGVLLFSKNFESPAQLAELVNSIQALRKDFPLFIAVDHEGGRVIRFKQGFTQFPPMLDISSLDSPKMVFDTATIMASELSSCGINVNFSPCCDVLTNEKNQVIGDRSFSCEPDKVAKFVSSAIRGFQTNNILSCAKHFPGHGSTFADSHEKLPIVKTSMEDLEKCELIPFNKAIKARVEFVMMGHLQVDCIDQELPCSLSPRAHKLLRSKMRFSKIIVSDDMQMGAITKSYSVQEAAVLALRAGTDLLEYRDMDQMNIALEGVRLAIKEKSLNIGELEKSVARIRECKVRTLKEYKPIYLPALSQVFNKKTSQVFLQNLQDKIEQ